MIIFHLVLLLLFMKSIRFVSVKKTLTPTYIIHFLPTELSSLERVFFFLVK